MKRLLARREHAIEDGRRAVFQETVARRDRDGQLAWFAVLDRLPVADVEHDVSGIRLMPDSDVTEVSLQMTVRLRGFDPKPVAASHVLELVRSGRGWRVVRDRFAKSQVMSAPWTMADARVRVTDDVVLLLDGASEEQADRLVRLAQEALAATRDHVPFDWHDRVVVLAPSSITPLRNEGYEVEQIKRLGRHRRRGRQPGRQAGGAAGARRTPDARRVGRRAADPAPPRVRPRRDRRARPRPAALGLRGDGGVELVGRALSYRIATSAVNAAERGIEEMPEDAAFRGTDPGRAYGIAWFALRWLEDEYGDRDAVAGARAGPPAPPVRRPGALEGVGPAVGCLHRRARARSGDLIDDTFQ